MQKQMPENQTPIGYFKAGYDAAEAGLSIEACPLLFDAWPRMAWRDGYKFFNEYRAAKSRPIIEELRRIPVDPYEQGRNARFNEIAITDNPYGTESQDACQWENGWLEGDNQKHDGCARFTWLWTIAIVLVIIGVFVYLS